MRAVKDVVGACRTRQRCGLVGRSIVDYQNLVELASYRLLIQRTYAVCNHIGSLIGWNDNGISKGARFAAQQLVSFKSRCK
jgi:hypothetical protein